MFTPDDPRQLFKSVTITVLIFIVIFAGIKYSRAAYAKGHEVEVTYEGELNADILLPQLKVVEKYKVLLNLTSYGSRNVNRDRPVIEYLAKNNNITVRFVGQNSSYAAILLCHIPKHRLQIAPNSAFMWHKIAIYRLPGSSENIKGDAWEKYFTNKTKKDLALCQKRGILYQQEVDHIQKMNFLEVNLSGDTIKKRVGLR